MRFDRVGIGHMDREALELGIAVVWKFLGNSCDRATRTHTKMLTRPSKLRDHIHTRATRHDIPARSSLRSSFPQSKFTCSCTIHTQTATTHRSPLTKEMMTGATKLRQNLCDGVCSKRPPLCELDRRNKLEKAQVSRHDATCQSFSPHHSHLATATTNAIGPSLSVWGGGDGQRGWPNANFLKKVEALEIFELCLTPL